MTVFDRNYIEKNFRNDINLYNFNQRLGVSSEDELDNVLELLNKIEDEANATDEKD